MAEWMEPVLLTAVGTAVATVLGGVSLCIKRIAEALPEFRNTVDWHDERKQRQDGQRAISTVSPPTGTITKRSA
jgi:hypothetical protein